VSYSTPRPAPRPYFSPDAIDTEPLQGRGRREFELKVLAMASKGRQDILHWILWYCGGKAECWVSKSKLAERSGFSPRYVQRILRDFEGRGATDKKPALPAIIKCVTDRSLKSQRRIILIDHPHALKVIARFDSRPWMHSGENTRAPKSPVKVDAGENKPVSAGENKVVGSGENNRPPKRESSGNAKIGTFGILPPSERRKTPPANQQLDDLRRWIAAHPDA
jgi:hypothetical protein